MILQVKYFSAKYIGSMYDLEILQVKNESLLTEFMLNS